MTTQGPTVLWLAIQGFLIAFVWEMFQMPFYEMEAETPWAATKVCGAASLGDAGIMVAAAWVTGRVSKGSLWAEKPSRSAILIYLGAGIGVTIAIEWLAVRSEWGWKYSSLMPEIFGIGLVPVAMWIVVPSLSLFLCRQIVGSRSAL